MFKKIAASIARILVLLTGVLIVLWLVMARPYPVFESQKIASDIKVDQALLLKHVRILSEDFSPRNYVNVENLNLAASYIKNQFEEMGLVVIEQEYMVDKIEYKNLIVNIGPEVGDKIVVGAHYDVAGPFAGADDNASGVAGLIELGRHLNKLSLDYPVTLVAYTLEEPPFFATEAMGSFHHAKGEHEADSSIDLMISLEMIGYYSEDENSQTFPMKMLALFYPTKGNFIAVVDRFFSDSARKLKAGMTRHTALPIYSINAPSVIPGVDYSDHRNYWAHDYDAVMITDTSFYRNTAYHTEHDTADRLNYGNMAEIVSALFAYLRDYKRP